MTRLARHDEIVERMARAVFAFRTMHIGKGQLTWEIIDEKAKRNMRIQATAALDALLTAVVELRVGDFAWMELDAVRKHPTKHNAIVLQLEDKP